jgi:hypothetical protein
LIGRLTADLRARPDLVVLAVIALPLLAWNALGLAQTTLWLVRHGGENGDWFGMANLTLDDPYGRYEGFRWSPPAAWLWVLVVQPIGLLAWRLLHLVALALTRDRVVIIAGLLSWAFWQDFANGNIVTFVLLAAWWAIRGNTFATVGYLALCALVPRPLMLPVLAWLLWTRPATRIWFAAIAVGVIGLSAISGQLDEWVTRLVATSNELASPWNIGPSAILGPVWIPIGVALAVLLARRGWLGLASLAITPYVFAYYLLIVLLDVPKFLALLGRTGVPMTSRPLRWIAGYAGTYASTRMSEPNQ